MLKPRFHSRVAKQVWKCLIALAGQDVPTSELIRWAFPRKQKFHSEEYKRVKQAARQLGAEAVGRDLNAQGRPWLWRLKADIARL
jgi:hypothetical protein